MKLFLKILMILLSIFLFFSCGTEDSGKSPQGVGTEPNKPRKPADEYTKDAPGEWKQIANEHIPEIKYNSSSSQDNVLVSVPLKTLNESHYIERIGIIDAGRNEVTSKPINRGEPAKATLSFDKTKVDSSSIKVYVKCNLHDLWTVPLESATKL